MTHKSVHYKLFKNICENFIEMYFLYSCYFIWSRKTLQFAFNDKKMACGVTSSEINFILYLHSEC